RLPGATCPSEERGDPAPPAEASCEAPRLVHAPAQLDLIRHLAKLGTHIAADDDVVPGVARDDPVGELVESEAALLPTRAPQRLRRDRRTGCPTGPCDGGGDRGWPEIE